MQGITNLFHTFVMDNLTKRIMSGLIEVTKRQIVNGVWDEDDLTKWLKAIKREAIERGTEIGIRVTERKHTLIESFKTKRLKRRIDDVWFAIENYMFGLNRKKNG